MELLTIHEHTVCLDMLPKKAIIADLGCMDFLFTNYFRDLGHEVHAVDIQEFEGDYDRIAITDYNGTAYINQTEDPQARNIVSNGLSSAPIPCCTLKTFMKIKGVEMYDLIKMDVEGSEREIIMSLTKPPATQISVEFHCHTGIYGTKEVAEMVYKLTTLGYVAVQHEATDKHCAGENYWDSLFKIAE